VGEAFIIGFSKLESWGGRPRASALPTESAPTNIVKYIDRKRSIMKQPVVEAMAFFGTGDALYLTHLRVF
jgi:hypothetical protein